MSFPGRFIDGGVNCAITGEMLLGMNASAIR
jgi:hypothetical protein